LRGVRGGPTKVVIGRHRIDIADAVLLHRNMPDPQGAAANAVSDS
jgi:hypothetical protein